MKKKQSSTIRIEKVPLAPKQRSDGAFAEFVVAVNNLKVNESFVYSLNNQHRVALSTLRIALGRSFVTNRTEQKGIYRVGRIA